MADFTAIGTDAQRDLFLEESFVLVQRFPCTDATVKPGHIVQLLNTGLVARVTAATQRPLGYVTSAWDGNDKGHVRVSLPFVACIERQTTGTVLQPNTLVAATGVDGNNVTTYAAATSGQYATGVILNNATPATGATVGILRQPILIA